MQRALVANNLAAAFVALPVSCTAASDKSAVVFRAVIVSFRIERVTRHRREAD